VVGGYTYVWRTNTSNLWIQLLTSLVLVFAGFRGNWSVSFLGFGYSDRCMYVFSVPIPSHID